MTWNLDNEAERRATLHEDASWAVTEKDADGVETDVPDLAEMLGKIYHETPLAGPQYGMFGPALLHDLAERVDGTVEMLQDLDAAADANEPGVIY